MENLSEFLKEKRKQAGLSQQLAAERLDVSKNTIQNWESSGTPNAMQLRDISNVYQIEPEEFLPYLFDLDRSEFPDFLFSKNELEIIRMLRFNSELQELFSMLFIYSFESASREESADEDNQWKKLLNLSKLPSDYIKDKKPAKVLSLSDQLGGMLEYIDATMIYDEICESPNKLFDVRLMATDRTLEFIKNNYFKCGAIYLLLLEIKRNNDLLFAYKLEDFINNLTSLPIILSDYPNNYILASPPAIVSHYLIREANQNIPRWFYEDFSVVYNPNNILNSNIHRSTYVNTYLDYLYSINLESSEAYVNGLFEFVEVEDAEIISISSKEQYEKEKHLIAEIDLDLLSDKKQEIKTESKLYLKLTDKGKKFIDWYENFLGNLDEEQQQQFLFVY